MYILVVVIYIIIVEYSKCKIELYLITNIISNNNNSIRNGIESKKKEKT